MKNKFLDGLVFGAGFAVSYFIISWLSSWLWMSFGGFQQSIDLSSVETEGRSAEMVERQINAREKPFHEMTVDDQIQYASVIARAEFETAENGEMKAIIKEFIKKDAGVTVYHDIGEEYPFASYYPDGEARHGEGVVIFFVDSPASMRRSMTYDNERIGGLGNMPLDLLRQKASEPE